MSIFNRKVKATPLPQYECEVHIELEQTPFDRWNYHVRTYRNGKHTESYGNAHTGYSTKGIALEKATRDDSHSPFREADNITVTIKLYNGELLEWFGRDNDEW